MKIIDLTKVIDLENIKIPSINHKYVLSRGRLVLSIEYRIWKNFIKQNCIKKKIGGPYCVDIYIDTNKDIDNCIKMIIDAIADAGVVDNDKNIVQLFVSKQPIKKGYPEKLIVLVGTKK